MLNPASTPDQNLDGGSASIVAEARPLEAFAAGPAERRRFEIGSTNVTMIRTPAAWANAALVSRTVYLFHAGQADDRMYGDLGLANVLAEVAAPGTLDRFQFVCPSIGDSFLTGAAEAEFDRVLQPWAEAGTSTSDAGRWIGGASMGGFVALSRFLSRPARYAGVVANAPAMLTWDFFDADETLAQESRTGLPAATAQYLASFFGAAFGTYEEYRRRDPLALAARLPAGALAGKSVYLDVGSRDDLGLSRPTAQLDQAVARLSPARRHFELVDGGRHDPAFLAGQLSKTLRFILG